MRLRWSRRNGSTGRGGGAGALFTEPAVKMPVIPVMPVRSLGGFVGRPARKATMSADFPGGRVLPLGGTVWLPAGSGGRVSVAVEVASAGAPDRAGALSASNTS